MGKPTDIGYRPLLIFISLLLMVSGLFVSRALLSLSLGSLFLLTLVHPGLLAQLRRFLQTPLLWGMGLLFFLPLVSGLWSDDGRQWGNILRIKLPLLLMPLAFAGPVRLGAVRWYWLILFFIGCTVLGTLWSVGYYLADPAAAHEGYLRAKTLLTPLQNDHVRFSWLVSVAILACGWLAFSHKHHRKFKRILLLTGAWLVIYLHLLAARTGLLCFYLSLPVIATWLVVKNKNTGLAWLTGVLALVLPLTAYFLFPTFQNRVKYMLYDKGFFEKAHYLPGGNDAVRVISWKAGWQVMNAKPLTGVGFGDVALSVKDWYRDNYPSMEASDKILPANEWLMYGAGNGWPGFLLFTLGMILPFFTPVRYKLPWWILNTGAACSLLFDIGLEVQYGVFAYAMTVLVWWKWLNDENGASLQQGDRANIGSPKV